MTAARAGRPAAGAVRRRERAPGGGSVLVPAVSSRCRAPLRPGGGRPRSRLPEHRIGGRAGPSGAPRRVGGGSGQPSAEGAASAVPSATSEGRGVVQQAEASDSSKASASPLTTYTSQGSPPGPVTHTLSCSA